MILNKKNNERVGIEKNIGKRKRESEREREGGGGGGWIKEREIKNIN